jgi:sulfatase maturation enzyme AslB (radical SAM superfamily)
MNKHLKVRAGPDGVHWFDRRTGFNILIDDVLIPSAQWSCAPRQVSIALTNACDLQCPYCYAPKHVARLKYEEVATWLDELDRAGCLGIGFGGGEPTLHPDFARLCQFAAENTTLAVTFTTHAHYLDDELAEKLSGHVHFIRVSMDGIGTTYESFRGKSFAEFLCQLAQVRSLAPFGINFVVNAVTFRDIDAAVALAVEVGAVEFLLLPERAAQGRSGIDDITRRELCAWVNAARPNIRLTISEGDAAGFPTCDPLAKEKGLRSYAHVDAARTLKRSSFDEQGVVIGPAGISKAIEQLRQSARAQ